MSTVYYTSTRNALKRSSISGSVNMAAPSTGAYIVGGTPTIYVTNLTIPHGLMDSAGNPYTPLFRYYYEPFGDGIIWPPLTDRNTGYAQNPLNIATHGPGIIAWADNTNLYLQLYFNNNTLVGTYPVYYVIYKDFKLL